MTNELPTAVELVEAAAAEIAALRQGVAAGVDPAPRLALVAHVLRLAARDLRSGAAADAAERDRLLALSRAPVPAGTDLDRLRADLADAIRAGSVDPADPDLRAHLRDTVEATLAIDSPRHAASRGH